MSIKKKILIILPYIPYPPYNGGAVRIFNLLKNTYMHCEISLIFPLDTRFNSHVEFLKPFCKNIYTIPTAHEKTVSKKLLLFLNVREWPRLFKKFSMLLYGAPFSVAKFYQLGVVNKLKEVLLNNDYDIVQFEYTSMSVYFDDIIGYMGKAKAILVKHDIVSIQQKRRLKHTSWPKNIFYAIDYFLMLGYERKILPKFDHIIAMSELDKKILLSFGLPNTKISVIRNGANIEKIKDRMLSNPECHIVFLGTMAFIPNRDGLLWFINKIFPRIISEVKEVTLQVIGDKDSNITRKYTNDHVKFLGIVDDLEIVMGKGIIFIAPIRIGAGTKLKIITAMAFGMPVVSTSIGIEGIEASEAEGVIVADTENSFATAVINLSRDKEKRIQLGECARRFIKQKYTWSAISKELLLLYNSI